MPTITTRYRRSERRWAANPGDWSTEYVFGPTRREAIARAIEARRSRAAALRDKRRRRRQILDGLRAWLGGDRRYAPYILLAWRHFTGYGNSRRCWSLAMWKEYVVDQMRYEAWRNRWESGWSADPQCRNGLDVWYAETPAGQISFHAAGMPVASIPGDRAAQREAEIEADAVLEMSAGKPFCRIDHASARRAAKLLGLQRRVCLAPHTRPWDGQRDVVAERIATYYGINLPEGAEYSDWSWALRECGATITVTRSWDIYDERGW